MEVSLFEALARVDGGDRRRRGDVLLDRLHVYRHWIEADGTACFEGTGGPTIEGIPDQTVLFDMQGAASVFDSRGAKHSLRVSVKVQDHPAFGTGEVPYNGELRSWDLLTDQL